MIGKTRASISFVPHTDYIALNRKITEFSPAGFRCQLRQRFNGGFKGFSGNNVREREGGLDTNTHEARDEGSDDRVGNLGIFTPFATGAGKVHDLCIGSLGLPVPVKDLCIVRLCLDCAYRFGVHRCQKSMQGACRLGAILCRIPIE